MKNHENKIDTVKMNNNKIDTVLKLGNPIEKHFATVTRFHIYIFFFLFLCKVPVFWHVLNFLFFTPPMTYTCSGGGKCCPDPVWNTSVFTYTIQMKYNLICEKKWLVSVTESTVSTGSLFGAFVFGFLSDRYGRLMILSICCFIIALSGCLTVVMPNVGTYIMMRFIEGFGLGGSIVTSFVLLVEYCGVQYRETVTALYHIPMNLGHISLVAVSYIIRNCDHLQIALSVPLFMFALMKFHLQESPKWLMDSDRVNKAAKVMKKVLIFNKKPHESILAEMTAYHASQTVTTPTKVKFWQIFKHKRLTINFFCMAYIYFVCGMCYYGVSQYIGRMSGDIHINVVVSGAMLLPGTFASVFLLKIINRRPFLMATSGSAGFLMLVVICIPAEYAFARVAVACVCNCFFFMSFIICFLYGVELFPTSVRNSALGILSVVSRLGQIFSPPINRLPEAISGCIFGVSALIGAAVCFPLPETKNRELPSSLEDAKLPRTRLSLT